MLSLLARLVAIHTILRNGFNSLLHRPFARGYLCKIYFLIILKHPEPAAPRLESTAAPLNPPSVVPSPLLRPATPPADLPRPSPPQQRRSESRACPDIRHTIRPPNLRTLQSALLLAYLTPPALPNLHQSSPLPTLLNPAPTGARQAQVCVCGGSLHTVTSAQRN